MSVMRDEYPRPQFVRDDWMTLNGQWDFCFDDENIGITKRWYKQFPKGRTIIVPFAYQSKLSGINDTSFHDVVWYRKTFKIPKKWEGKEIILHFGAVDYRAWVYVNGELATYHEGGNTPFSTNITHLLQGAEKEEQIVVRVEDPSEDTTIPRGKQFWHRESKSIFYTRTTGIWQTVWIEAVEKERISWIRWTPKIDDGDIQLEFELEGSINKNLSLQLDILYKGEPIISDVIYLIEKYNKRIYNIRNYFPDRSNIHDGGWYWTPEHPNLFDAVLTLKKDNSTVDKVKSYFGMRKVSIENGKFLLNNRVYYQKLILDQGYFPESLLTAPSGEALKRDIELAKKMGFNGARKHQKVEDPIYLYWADKLGFLVWGEMANCQEYSEGAAKRLVTEWFDVIKRDYNHPSIVTWVPLNESWGIPRVNFDMQQQAHSLTMYYLTKSIDSTRPVLSNDGWEHTISDICGIHNYQGCEELSMAYKDVDSAISAIPANRQIYAKGYKYNGEPILITEFGGISYKVDAQEGWGYSNVDSSDKLVEEYRKLIESLKTSKVIQGFCYTQLTDVEQETNGLLTYDRKPKCDLKKIKEINDSIDIK